MPDGHGAMDWPVGNDPTRSAASIDQALQQALLGQEGFGVAVCDADGVLTHMNHRMEQIAGQRYRATPLARWSRWFHLYDQDGTRPLGPGKSPLAMALAGHEVLDEVISIRPPDQPVRFVRCNAAPLYGPNHETLGAVVFVVDVTRQITAHRELDDLRNHLIETVNHELRTPLALIAGHLELLHELDRDVPTDARWSWDALTHGAARLQAVVDTIAELSDLARIAAIANEQHPFRSPLSDPQSWNARAGA